MPIPGAAFPHGYGRPTRCWWPARFCGRYFDRPSGRQALGLACELLRRGMLADAAELDALEGCANALQGSLRLDPHDARLAVR